MDRNTDTLNQLRQGFREGWNRPLSRRAKIGAAVVGGAAGIIFALTLLG